MSVIKFFIIKKKLKSKKKIITFLPGSRESEIKNNINEFFILITNTISQYKNFTFYILTFKDHLSLFAEIKKNLKIILKLLQTSRISKKFFQSHILPLQPLKCNIGTGKIPYTYDCCLQNSPTNKTYS